MRKHLSLMMLLAALIVPWVANAQGTVISTFPFACDFESADDTAYWSFSNSGNGWYIDSAANNTTGGSMSLYISDDNGATNNYSVASCVSYAWLTFYVATPGQYALSFDWKCAGESTYDFLRVAVSAESTALPTSYSSWTSTSVPTGFLAADGGNKLNLQTTWQTTTSIITATDTGTYRIIFVWRNDGSVYNNPPAAIDNVVFTELSCPQPVALTVVPSVDQLDLSWTPGGTESEWMVTLDDSIAVFPTDTFYTFTSLDANTPYTVKVYAVCGSGDTSFATVANVRTTCTMLDSLPYVQDFESDVVGSSTSAAFANCMTRLNNGTTNFGYPYVGGSSYNHTAAGARGLYWYNSTTTGTYGDYQIVVLPQLDTTLYPVNTLQLTFWSRPSTTSYSPQFQVGVMSDPSDPSTFQLVRQVNVANNTNWQEFTVMFGSYSDTGSYIAIRAQRPTSSWYAYLDDITLSQMPTCPPIESATARTTVSSAILSWNYNTDYGITPSGYTVSYRLASDTTATPVTVTTTEPMLAITGLDADTDYVATIAAQCAADNGEGYTLRFSTVALPCIEWDTTSFGGTPDTLTVGTPGTSTCAVMPVNQSYNYSYCQHLVKASELDNNGPVTLTGIGFDYAYTQPMTHATTCSLYVAHTSVTAMTAFFPYDSLQLVYIGPLNCTTSGWNYFQFNQGYFNYNGTSNLIVAIVDNSGSSDGESYVFRYSTVSSITRRVYSDAAPYDSAAMAAASTTSNSQWRSNMKLLVGGGDCILQASCAAPAVTATQTADGDIRVDWAPGYLESSWDFDYKQAGDTAWINLLTGSSLTNYTFPIDSLTPNTQYIFRVLPNCTDTVIASITTYTTPCRTVIPYFEDFDGITTSTTAATGVRNECWDYYMTGTSTYQTGSYLPQVYYSSSNAHSGNYSYRLYGVGYHMLPEMPVSLDSLQLTFWDYTTSTSYGLEVGVMENGSFVPLQVISTPTSTHQMYEINFTGYTGNSRTIAFRNYYTTSTSTYYSYHYIDDVQVTYLPACMHPDDLVATSASASSISVEFTGNGGTSFRLYYSDGVTTDSVDITDSTYVITGLTSATTYNISVATICSDGSISLTASITANTAMVGVDLPYSTGFEAGDDVAWMLENGTQTNKWYIDTAVSNSGSHALYISDNNGASNSYSISSPSNVYAYKAFNVEQGQYAVSFDWRAEGEEGFDYLRAFIAPGSASFESGNANDISTSGAPTGWIALDGGIKLNLQSTWQNNTATFPVADTGVVYLVFFWHNDGSVGTMPPAAVDNVAITQLSCPQPVNLAVDSVDQSMIGVSWNPGATETQWMVSIDDTAWVTVTDTFYVFTGLDANTQYTVSVLALCGVGDTSFTTTLSVRTACGILTLPYTEDFESQPTGSSTTGTSFINCWTRLNNGTSYGGYPYISSNSTYNHTAGGTKGLYWYNTTTTGTYGDYQYIVFPPVDTTVNPINTLEVVFWARTSSASYNPTFQIGVMNNPNDTAITVVGTVNLAGNINWDEYTVSLNSFVGSGQYVAIRALRPTSSWYAYVDDITLEPIPSCPHVNNITVGLTTYDSIQITWTPGGTETEWLVSSDGTTWTSAYDSTYVFTGLTASTEYTLYVRPVCGVGDTGYARSVTGRTSCGYATLPYSENFDSYTTSTTAATGVQALCWDAILTGTSSYTTGSYVPQVYYSTTYPHSGSYCYRLYGVGYHMLPPMPTSLDSLQLTFWDYTSSASYGLEVGVMEGTTFVPIQTINTPNSNHMQHTVYFSNYTGTSRVIAFRNFYTTSTSTYYSYHYIDNVEVDYLPTCPPVVSITAVGGSTSSIDVDWVDLAPASSWQLRYGQSASSMTTVTVNSHPYTITGLDTLTAYNVEVRPICSVGDTGVWSQTVSLSTEMCDNATVAFTGAATGTSNQGPVNNYYKHTLSQTIIDSAELAGMGEIGYIAYSYNYATATTKKTNVNIWLQPTNLTEFASTDAVPLNTATAVKVYHGSLNCSQGWNYFALDTTYTWDGHSNLLVIVQDNSGQYDGSAYVFDITSTTDYKYLIYYRDGTAGTDTFSVYNPALYTGTSKYRYQRRPTMKLVSCTGSSCPTPVISSVSNDYATATINVTGSGNSFELTYGTDPSNLASTVISTTGVFNLSGLTPSTQYYFEVVQMCDSGLVSSPAVGTFTTDDLPCFEPTDLAVAATTFNSAVLSWTSAGNATTWVVEINGAGNQRFDTVGTNPYIVTGLYSDQQYTASVRAICLLGVVESPWSDTLTFSTDACSPVNGVTVNNITNSSATVNWQPSTGALGYKISYGDSNFYDADATTVEVDANTTSYTMTGLDAEWSYEVFVQTKCGENTYSSVATEDRIAFRTTSSSEGIYDVESGTLTLYPNPASTSVTLSVSGIDGEATVEVVDMNGRTVATYTTVNHELGIDVSTLGQGAYFVRVTGERQTAVRKLIVR